MDMELSATRLVERLKEAAVRVGTEGVKVVVDSTVTAVRMMDRLQELLPTRERVMRLVREPARAAASPNTRPMWETEPRLERPMRASPVQARPMQPRPVRRVTKVPREQRETAERVLAEVEAVQVRLKEAKPARHPLKVAPDLEEAAPKRRKTSGRKTSPVATTSPKQATAPKEGGFKAKRGQKHRH